MTRGKFRIVICINFLLTGESAKGMKNQESYLMDSMSVVFKAGHNLQFKVGNEDKSLTRLTSRSENRA